MAKLDLANIKWCFVRVVLKLEHLHFFFSITCLADLVHVSQAISACFSGKLVVVFDNQPVKLYSSLLESFEVDRCIKWTYLIQ